MDIAHIAPQLALHNQSLNQRMIEATARLPHERQWANLGAFFKSIMGTLNHIYVTDIVWLQRVNAGTTPFAELTDIARIDSRGWNYSTIVFDELSQFEAARQQLDNTIVSWAHSLTERNLNEPMHYQNLRGIEYNKPLGAIVLQLFTHQIHHRGHVTCMLAQEGQLIDGTGFLNFIS
jgi:uncharacterized damage-inducible protein DinB